ncbi:T9SS type B sorting domain-containing protein [Psychroflexus salis]|uniref:Gliding motility-associated C-terminal domain-containing protein n=1 Tax=Psychroflexus salis TaxID=1526574 RepID=A0A917E9V7_9FLAO|nr:T9SS type B sorting domain-containing protein [Psychroflexus salis]GGE17630.1 hypothetical protein GCM10010831_18610 [Psychroflexus salis]
MKSLFLLFLLIFSVSSFSQGEANNWYFGQFAGVTFNTNPPSSLNNGQLTTLEGCSSISDSAGNLVFYTDGRTVWDKEHNIMPNADYFNGTGLMGDPSSTSSGLIVPHPTNPNLYYIFTVDEPHHNNANAYPNQGPADINGNSIPFYDEGFQFTIPQEDDGYNHGFNYSLVDMNLRNGLGDVIPDQRNLHLVTYDVNDPEEIKYKCAEKITAVVNDNCNSIWVITHFINRFYAFSIDENGVDPNPVITEIGPTIPLSSYRRGALGYLKASPNGEKLIVANLQNANSGQNTGNIYLYDFNNATGELENPLLLKDNTLAYGVEFSPNSKVAYATSTGDLLQWNIEADDILSTEYVVQNTTNLGIAIQLAPNGKIYFPQQQTSLLKVINSPNNLGESMGLSDSLDDGAIDLGENIASIGLPPFIQSIFTSRIGLLEEGDTNQIKTQLKLCEGETFELSYTHETSATYQWYENGEPIENETSSTLVIPLNLDSTENLNYTLDVFPDDGECALSGIANVLIEPLPQIQNASINKCVTDIDDFSSEFNLNDAQENVLTNNLNSNDFIFSYFLTEEEAYVDENAIQNETEFTSFNDTTIFVRVENEVPNCFSVSEITLRVTDYTEGETYDLLRCDDNLTGIQNFDLSEIENNMGAEISGYYESINDALNQNNSILNFQTYTNEESYANEVYYRIENNTCSTIGKVNLTVFNLPMLSESFNYTYCLDSYPETIEIKPNINENEADLYSYFWPHSNQTTYQVNINEAGNYSVLVTDLDTGCEAIQQIEVTGVNLARFSLVTQDATRYDNFIEVVIHDDSLSEYEFALNDPFGPFQDSPRFENLEPGFYTVYVKEINGCGIIKRNVALLGIMPYFSPNNDGINDYWKVIGLDNNIRAKIRIFDRYGKLLHEFDEANTGWDGTYNGNLMLNNDYWYAIHLDDGRVLRGNFTLKR